MTFKRFISDFYNYNKGLFYTILSVVIIIIIGIVIFLNTSNDEKYLIDQTNATLRIEKLYLFGKNEITLEQGEKYIEPGYYAVSSDGKIVSNDVIVTPDIIDTTKAGTYYINYVIGDKKEKRKIIVLEKEIGELSLELEGDSTIILEVGEEYVEPGFQASDTVLGDVTDKVEIDSNLDITKSGNYEIIYKITNDDEEITKTRSIIVKDTHIEVSITTNLEDNYTNNNIIATIEVTGDNFNYIRYPDNTISKSKISNYTISKNAYYEFYIYDKDSNYIVKELNVVEIDKEAPTGSCNISNINGQSTIQVLASDNLSGIKKYDYYNSNNQLINTSSNNTYTTTNITSGYVNIYDNANNYSKVNCNLVKNIVESKYDYLEMHFIITGYNDDAILIRTGEATILIDSGRKGTENKVISYLQSLGVKEIDALIGSHPHYNHIQSQAFVIEKFPVKNSYYTVDLNTCASKNYCDSVDVKYIKDAIKKYNIPMNVTKAGDVIYIGDMTLYFLGPYKLNNTAKYKQNNNSSIFILKYKNNTFMFTGDADTDTFNYSKVSSYAKTLGISLDVDMLKYPHHGNADLDSKLVNAMKPNYVVIPNYNYGNKLSSSGKSKLTNVGAKIYQLASDGNVVLISDGSKITVKKNQKAATYKR